MTRNGLSLYFLLACLSALVLGIAGCKASPGSVETPEVAATRPNSTAAVELLSSPTAFSVTQAAAMPNPASVFCEENGGVLDIRQDSAGGESGMCIFPDGSQCDEWAYFRGECQPGGGASQSETPQLASTPDLAAYAFPTQVDPSLSYLFYLHGKIIEDQGIPAVSPDFGEYHYGAILEKLGQPGLRVISEVRPKDTDGVDYARHVVEQVQALLEAGVPPEHITVVGASKGGGIAIAVSNLLKNEKIHYVPMAICHPDVVSELINDQVVLSGNVLSIYDSADSFAGSCSDLFDYSEGKGLARHEELVLNIGTGHGILYQPLDEWLIPVLKWAGGDY